MPKVNFNSGNAYILVSNCYSKLPEEMFSEPCLE